MVPLGGADAVTVHAALGAIAAADPEPNASGRALAAAFAPLDPLICYSIKSCPNVHLCRLLAQRGAGFDVVSGGRSDDWDRRIH